MPNHVHAIAIPDRPDALAKAFGRTHNAYSRYLNRLRGRSGHLWQNRFYSAPLGPEHLLSALAYVDANPVRAELVERATDYAWSSARAHLDGADPAGLLDTPAWRRLCPLEDWSDLLESEQETTWADRLRAATHAGKPLADAAFVAQLERQQGRSLALRRPGRPPKTTCQPG